MGDESRLVDRRKSIAASLCIPFRFVASPILRCKVATTRFKVRFRAPSILNVQNRGSCWGKSLHLEF